MKVSVQQKLWCQFHKIKIVWKSDIGKSIEQGSVKASSSLASVTLSSAVAALGQDSHVANRLKYFMIICKKTELKNTQLYGLINYFKVITH